MQTKVLSEFKTEENQVLIVLEFFDKGARNVGVFWQKSQHEYYATPHFVPIVVMFSAVKEEEDVVVQILRRIADESEAMYSNEISSEVMALIATKWLKELGEG